MKKYEILGGNLPVVVCELSAGESMITESGSMSWMSPNMKMETISGGGMKKMFGRLMSGDSAFQNRYTAEGADGMIAFASSFPGAIKALEISNGHSMIVQKSAFLASEEGVELSMHFQKKLGKGIFGGESFIYTDRHSHHLSGHRYPFSFIRVLLFCFSGASTTSQYYHTDDKH